ncbi:two-component regulator propeller domain-containing protein [Maribacter sp. 2210JD10-5]|uniref:hybrid sensor histidine kinase/response regulator transcription factor n=1 Tax=Maribacter sp. 2210JD10-5 TaxID=3386272 RepID=UPI0039BC6FA8
MLLFSCGWQAIYSQKTPENYNFVGVKESISQRAISSIIEDSYGFIWIGTISMGIYRYDGINHNLYTYDFDDEFSIGSNGIYCTFLDSDNRLWVGTSDGLSLYNRDFDRFERIDIKGSSTLLSPNVVVKSMNEDNNRNLIVGTYGNGLLSIDLDSFKVSKISSDEDSEPRLFINSLKKTKSGRLYGATSLGLKYLDEEEKTFKQATFNIDGTIGSISEYLESLVVDQDDNLWLGTASKGLMKVSNQVNSVKINHIPVTNKRILSLLNSDENTLLVGTENDGLYALDLDGNVIQKYEYSKFGKNSLASNSIWSLFSDKQSRIWIGYYNKGVGVYDKLYNKFNAIESLANNINSLQAASVTGIAKDKNGQLWIGMEGGGVDIYDTKTKEFIHVNSKNKSPYKGLESDDIQTVFIDSKENIWVGSWSGGIYFLEKGSKKFINYNIETTNGSLTSDGILSFTEDSRGVIWIASFLSGLHYYDPDKNAFFHCNTSSFINLNLINSDVRVVFADSRDNIWMGTTSGLYKVNMNDKGEPSVVSMKNRMPKELRIHPSTHHILSIYEDREQQLWIGTEGGGLFNYHEAENLFIKYDDIYDFNDTSINAIIEGDDGSLWVSGKSGISRLDIKNKKTTNYTVDDGLLGNYFNNSSVLKDENGTLYFGGYLGVNYFNPKELEINKVEPTLYFSDFKLFNKKVLPTDEKSPLKKVISETESITLNHEQSVFTIEFSTISFTRPEKNQYAYYMDGFETDWNYVGNVRNATYTNLPQGDYVFKVKSANNDGVWNQSPLELKITILPPWWMTRTAYSIYLVIFSIAVFMLNKFLKDRFREKQAIRFERDKRLQEEQLHNKKLQFFTNISHEFRTPLTLIKNPIEDLIKNKNLDLPREVKEKHKIIHKNSDRLSRLINELLDFRKLQSNKIPIQAREIDVVSFVNNTVEYFKEEAAHRDIELNFAAPTNRLMAWLDPDMLEKIVFNLLSNAFKVTPENGTISVAIRREKEALILPLVNKVEPVDAFTISVEDTGPGLDQKEYKKIFNRFYQVGKLNKSYYGSTGIGLEMVKNFMMLHKGKIEVGSKIQEGTRFTVTFPLGKKHFNQNEVQFSEEGNITNNDGEQIENIENQLEENSKEHTLMIVEDNPELRDYLKGELKKLYNIIVAENGLKGLEIAADKLPNIILTDVIMPEMDGFEMCRQIKSDIKTSHIPLLMLTAKAMPNDKVKGIDSGADAYLTKPFNMDVLKATLSQLVTSRRILFNKNYDGISEDSQAKATTLDNVFVQKVLEYINENIDEPDLSVEQMASQFFLSRSQLYRKVKTLTGDSVTGFIRKVKLQKAKNLLASGNNNISEVAYMVGFSSPSYFTKCYKAEFGHLPTQRVHK